ncbi:RHS repeat-associated core domain-containing protein [Amycolatopsis coloradensis]|uniref:RHS repeat-associated core domain-containing protein n=1 Tax=Amycolatopsis coloradensis TaxID=76021 RepID=A0ACD5BEE5_9PSEU
MDELGRETGYEYDEDCALVAVHRPGGSTVLLTHTDGEVRLSAGDVRRTVPAFDPATTLGDGDVLVRRTSSGVDSEWRFTGEGLPRSLRIVGHEVEFGYDDAGREVTRSVDGTVVLRRRFDAEDRLAEEHIAGIGPRVYGYRPDGRLAAVDDAIRPWQLTYDTAGRVSEARGPAGVERFTHDAAGAIVLGEGVYSGDERGRVIGDQSCAYEWDHLDRLRSVRTPEGALWTYHYDPLGRRFAKRRWLLDPEGEAELTHDVRFLWSGMNVVERMDYDPADESYRLLTWERYDDDRPVVQIERTGALEDAVFRAVITSPAGTPTELLDEHGTLVWQDSSSFWGVPLPGADIASMPLAFPGQQRDEETGPRYNVFRYYDPRTSRYLSQDPLGLVPPCGKSGPGNQQRPQRAASATAKEPAEASHRRRQDVEGGVREVQAETRPDPEGGQALLLVRRYQDREAERRQHPRGQQHQDARVDQRSQRPEEAARPGEVGLRLRNLRQELQQGHTRGLPLLAGQGERHLPASPRGQRVRRDRVPEARIDGDRPHHQAQRGDGAHAPVPAHQVTLPPLA